MTKNKFLEIYQNVISKYVSDIMKIDDESGKHCLKFSSRKAMKIYGLYEKKRRYIRRYFMKREGQPMDRHKIGAVIMYAILKSRPFSVNKLIADLPNQLLMANEYLAFYMGMTIVESYRLNDDKLSVESSDDIESVKLILPCTYHGGKTDDCGEAYVDNVCRALYYIKSPKYFDIFAYADILFLLEKYTDILKGITNTQDTTD